MNLVALPRPTVRAITGNEGLVVNTVPARAGRPAQVRVLWDDETITITPLADVQVLPRASTS